MNAPMVTRRGAIESAKLHVRLDRTIHNGVHEDYEITNYSGEMIEFNLDLRFDGISLTSLMSRNTTSCSEDPFRPAGMVRNGH